MSYVHCPACSRAYNLATQASCPGCPVVAEPVDPTEDIAAAVETLARALARATPAERAAAAACMQRLALPAADPPRVVHDTTWRSFGNALTPVPPRPASRRAPLLAAIAFAVLDRIAPHAPKRLLRGLRAGVKALAA